MAGAFPKSRAISPVEERLRGVVRRSQVEFQPRPFAVRFGREQGELDFAAVAVAGPGGWTAITTAAIAAGTPAIPLKENRTGAGVEPLTMSGSAPLTIRGSDPFGLEKLLANGSNVLPELAGTRVTRASELSMVSRNSTR